MQVYVICSHHRAEGTEILAVVDREPDQGELAAFAGRSSYGEAERRDWCEVSAVAFEVEPLQGRITAAEILKSIDDLQRG